MFPTTISECSNANQFTVTCDVTKATKVAYRLQELCPDARFMTWTQKQSTKHPETGRFTATTSVTFHGDYTALRAYLRSKLRHTTYELSEELLASA